MVWICLNRVPYDEVERNQTDQHRLDVRLVEQERPLPQIPKDQGGQLIHPS